MQYNLVNILTGILALFAVGYVLIGVSASLYLKYGSKANNLGKGKFFISLAIASLAWIGATFLAVWAAATAGLIAFAVVAMVFIFTINFFITEKLFGIGGKHKVVYSLLLSLLLNPAWLSVLGVI